MPGRLQISAAEFARCFDHMLGVNPAFLHHFGAGPTQAELVQPDHFSSETDIFVPNLSHASFDSDAFTAFVRQNFFAVALRLTVESFKARHGNDSNAVAEFFRRGERMLQFAST